MKPVLSVLMPGIRDYNWRGLVDSIKQSITTSFEIIFVSPVVGLPDGVDEKNIKFVRDFGNPVRCFNIALYLAEGTLCTYGSDDGLYCGDVLGKYTNLLLTRDRKSIIAMASVEAQRYYSREFCFINKHPEIASPNIPDSYIMLMTPILYTDYFREIGGLDQRFETLAMADLDLSIRLQADGANVEFVDDIVGRYTHMPGVSGDHGPMHYAQIEHDEPLFNRIYRDPNYTTSTHVDINSWRHVPSVWPRRFNSI